MPMTDDDDSSPVAKCAGYPVRFINGMVNVPVVTLFVMELSEIIPKNVLDTTAVFAGPPHVLPVRAKALSVRN